MPTTPLPPQPAQSELAKSVTAVLQGLALAAVVWMVKTTSDNTTAYARIEERLAAQATMLVRMQQAIDKQNYEREQFASDVQKRLAYLEAFHLGEHP